MRDVKKALLLVVLPFLLVASTAIGLYWWDRGAPPGFRPRIVDVEVDTVTRDHRGVRITGTAHYEPRLKQREGGPDGQVWYLFPLMPLRDTTSRTIKVMIRTTRVPDDLYSFEEMTVEGLARPPGRMVPRYAEESILHKGYGFEDDYVVIEEFTD